MVRETGFYWVKCYSKRWTIGYYDGDDDMPWAIVGTDEFFNDDELRVIGDKIEYPVPQ